MSLGVSLPLVDPGELRNWWGGPSGDRPQVTDMGKLLQDLACSEHWGQQKLGPLGLEKGVAFFAPFQGPRQSCSQPQHPERVQCHRAQLCSVQGPRTLVISPWGTLLPLGRVPTAPFIAASSPGFLSPPLALV